MTPIARGTSNSLTDGPLQPGTYYYAVTASDNALNENKNVTSIKVEVVQYDTQAPSVSVNSLGNEIYGIVIVKADVSDNIALKNPCQACISSDGICDTEWVSATSNFSDGDKKGICTYSWDTSLYGKTTYSYNFRTYDLSNNLGQDTPLSVKVIAAPSNTSQKCNDGTPFNSCSSNKPNYCQNGSLIEKCQTCGCASGSLCNSTTGKCAVQVIPSKGISLFTGWNLISIPLDLNNKEITSALFGIEGKYNAVYSYDSTSKSWLVHDTNGDLFEQSNTLSSFELGKAYWIDMKENAVLNFSGGELLTYTIKLVPGWNFVGYPGLTEKALPAVLSTISNNYEIIYGYDSQNKRWMFYSPYTYGGLTNSLDKMEAGKGYWIYVYEPSSWKL